MDSSRITKTQGAEGERIIEMRFPFNMPMLNGSEGLIREHWAKGKKKRERLFWEIKSMNPPKFHGKVKLTYIRASVVAPDWDNLSASFKHWGDALVDAGVIKDDKPGVVVKFSPEWEKADNNDSLYTVIRIEEVCE